MLKRALSTTVLFGLLCWLGCASAVENTQAAIGQASPAAQSWLKLVDAGHYRRSYKESAAYFQSRTSEQRWAATVEPVRKPLGALLSRKLNDAQYTSTLPGAPDGQYVVMRFDTSFQNKKSAVETVTAMLDKDGKWRVCGYFIK